MKYHELAAFIGFSPMRLRPKPLLIVEWRILLTKHIEFHVASGVIHLIYCVA
jgi:hypothetical protein